jgi:general stress protein 26
MVIVKTLFLRIDYLYKRKDEIIMSHKALLIMNEKFGQDSLISLATSNNNVPSVRIVNSYYENGSFYIITYALSNKMKQIVVNPTVAICGEWFTANGVGENLGYICDEKNADIADKLRSIFAEWYSNGHIDETDPNTIILRIRLTNAILLSHGTRYDIDFNTIFA